MRANSPLPLACLSELLRFLYDNQPSITCPSAVNFQPVDL